MPLMNAAEAQIRSPQKVQMAEHDVGSFASPCTSERIAVALVLDRYDLLRKTGEACSRPSTASARNGTLVAASPIQHRGLLGRAMSRRFP